MNFDIFISFKETDDGKQTPDTAKATQLYNALIQRGYKVFFSRESVTAMGNSDYQDVIDNALDSAQLLIVVASKVEYIESEWLKYEWRSFNADILNGYKPDAQILTFIGGIELHQLPRTLRDKQSYNYADLEKLLVMVDAYFSRHTPPNAIGNEDTPPRKADEEVITAPEPPSEAKNDRTLNEKQAVKEEDSTDTPFVLIKDPWGIPVTDIVNREMGVEKCIEKLTIHHGLVCHAFVHSIYLRSDKAFARKYRGASHSYSACKSDELPLVLRDGTLLGSAKEGFVITDKNIYACDAKHNKAIIPLCDIQAITTEPCAGNVVFITSVCKDKSTFHLMPVMDKEELKKLIDFLKNVIDLLTL
ncbi:MAG: toll/interleukin-1 receptor domain-containing protein [Ruminococcaceae bacterium]|nr:toll/interleukin-1 receptor domain-containing protein [Oscillospiraceae bacterium]